MATPGKMKKKKKEVEFTADNIDNTAPVKKILEDLRNKNIQAYSFFNYNIRQRLSTKKTLPNFHFIVPGHPLNAFSDDWDGQLFTNYFEQFPYKSTKPKILTMLNHSNKTDPITELIKAKNEWQRQWRYLKYSATFNNMLSKYEVLNDDVVHCPKHLIDMAKHWDSDPDPHFDSSYNWYYAGHGNLQLISIQWNDYLLHSELSKLSLSDYNKNDRAISNSPVATFDCGEGINILETIWSSQNLVALRTKNKVFILRIVADTDEIKFEEIKTVQSEMPYTDISFDGYHKNILYVTTLDNKLTIVNLDRMKGRSVKLEPNVSLENNWNTVLSSERGFYIHISTKYITVYDKRANGIVHQWGDLRDVTDELLCNDITCALPTETPYFYIGTDHHLFVMDMRYSNTQNQKAKPINRWTHGMQCPPTYISKCMFGYNKDLVCLSSQWCEDMCVVPNDYDGLAKESDIINVTIPFRPPSIISTLKEARQKLLCHDLYNPIDMRLHTAITGSLITEFDEKFDVLMQNSLGDITCHTIFPNHFEIFMEDDSCQRLDEWSKSYKLDKKDFVVTSIVDIADIWKNLKKVPEGYKILDNRREMSKCNEDEIFEIFENEDLDEGLLELWTNKLEETVDQSSFALNLHFSDSDEDGK
ncbi:PREDICTED: uncharacterized protein LOC106119497 [Papilio xuthus]|uniref:Uncharacterized protein LOC106119497 n=1 Tax=Papilio xuthus TaxID=66420 RepID=A0AAJ6ZDA2_PAPXU|nr:PREDICTED: uncharacterized protein LOC106119497 [Papilio xuthus]